MVVSGEVYIGGAYVEAFDANGSTNCSGTPKVCQPLWTSSSNAGFTSPAVSQRDPLHHGGDVWKRQGLRVFGERHD